MPDAELGAAFPPVLAGLAYGAWWLDDRRRAPEGWPYPGVPMARPPIAWYDSVSSGPAVSEAALGAPLASLRGWSRAPGRPGTRGVFGYRIGTFSVEGASLLLQRGDSLRWVETDLSSWSRSPAEPLGPAGHHRWGFAGRWGFGSQAIAGAFAQRGAASRLESFEEQVAHGESGRLVWSWSRGGRTASVALARAWDGRSSGGPGLFDSRRDAGALRGETRGAIANPIGILEARLGAERSTVRRDVDPRFGRTAHAAWAGLSLVRELGDGTLTADFSAARHQVEEETAALDTLVWDRERFVLIPDLAYRFDRGGVFGGVRAGRRVAPVWSDLAPREAPFLQDTWAYGLEAGARRKDGSQLSGSVMLGRTRGRAILFRLPLEEQWLRLGAVRDPETSEFALATFAGEWRLRKLRIGGDVFGLARDASRIQPDVDPASGFRGWVETRFRLFLGDLGVALRADAAGVGARESESTVPLAIPGYVTFGASARLELGDALIVIRARNLENRLRPQPWIDLATGREALGHGRAIETSLTWTLFD